MPRPKRVLTEAEEKRLVAAYGADDVTQAKLGRRFQIDDKEVRRILDKYNVPRKANGR